MYTIRIEMFARAEPLVFDPDELSGEQAHSLHDLIEQMEKMDPEEAADQVFEEYSFDLCSRCRRRIHLGLKLKATEA